jgi:sugar phosphate isomerase/epimerase
MSHSIKLTPSLLFSTAPFFRRPLREAFRHVAEAGFDAVEVMVTQDPATREAHLLRRLATEFGLSVVAIHAPFLLVTRRVWGADPMGKVYRSVHLAEEVGASLVVAHPPYRWQVRYRRWIEEGLEDFSGQTGVMVAVENMFPIRIGGQRGVRFHAGQEFEDLERYPHLVLDTSHAAVSNHDLSDLYGTYRETLRHVHLSNNAGKGWDSHLPPDQPGVLDLSAFLDLLAADGFGGAIALELDLRPWLPDPVAVRDVMVRSREFCEKRLAEIHRP